MIGKYRLGRKLGEGGMGMVFEAVREDIGGRAAVKLLHAELARNVEISMRFFNEARAANLLEHPTIVRVFDYGNLPDGRAYLAMEYLEGESLASRIKRSGRLAIPDVLRLSRQIAAGLSAAHAKKVIHRDLKPANVMVVPESEMAGGERVKILDFGIAKLSESEAGKNLHTKTGALMGTPIYMSPEQCRGAGRVDEKTDVYSLGIMLFEMLAGGPPFSAEGQGEVIALHMFQPPPPLQHYVPEAPPELASLVSTMLAKDATVRPTMQQVAATLQSLAAQGGQTSIPPTSATAPVGSSPLASTLPPSSIRGSLHSNTRSGGGTRIALLIASCVLILGAGAALFLVRDPSPEPDATRAATEVPIKAKKDYERFLYAIGTGQYDAAMAAYRELSSDAPFRDKARADYERLLPLFIDDHLKNADTARRQGRCAEFHSNLQAILTVSPTQSKALAAKDLPCAEPSAEVLTKVETPDEVDQRLSEAQTEYVNGNYQKAIDIAKTVQKGSMVRAWRIIGTAACNIKDLKLVNDAYRRLDSAGRQYLVYVCQRNGIQNSGSQFKLAE
ncbi:MAG: serine/threonine protein kinase [Myxococcales bacterium]|nr:serine/threonine protein kinase [Myxococcales bacterium]